MSALNPINDSYKTELITVRDLLWNKGLKFSSPFSDEFVKFFRDCITRTLSAEEKVIQYTVYLGHPNQVELL